MIICLIRMVTSVCNLFCSSDCGIKPKGLQSIDLPIFVRGHYANNASAFDLNGEIPQHVDIPRLRKGQVGGFFWCVFKGCLEAVRRRS